MTPDPTPQPASCPSCGAPDRLTVRPPCSLDQYDPHDWHSFSRPTPQPTHDHGAAGFCTDHGQAPDARVETVEERLAEYAFDEEPLGAIEIESIRAGRCGPLLYGGPCWLMPGHVGPHHCYRKDIAAVVAALDDETARLRASADAWWSEYDRELTAHEATKAERDAARAALDRVRAVCAQIEAMPIPADPGISQTAITGRIVATITRAVRAALDPAETQACNRGPCHLPRGHDGRCNPGRDALPRERYDAVMDSGPEEPR